MLQMDPVSVTLTGRISNVTSVLLTGLEPTATSSALQPRTAALTATAAQLEPVNVKSIGLDQLVPLATHTTMDLSAPNSAPMIQPVLHMESATKRVTASARKVTILKRTAQTVPLVTLLIQTARKLSLASL
jgi:hypothetical protein